MRPTRTFHNGGISIDCGKSWTRPVPAPNAFLPNEAVVPLRQHAGPGARCVVRKGEFIREGAVIGRADTPMSANVHAPVPGIVKEIRQIPMPDGEMSEAVAIALEGSFDRLGRKPERYIWTSMLRRDILQCLRDRGIIETTHPGRPLFDLLAAREPPALLILNAVESDPYARSESAIIQDKTEEVLVGFDILRSILKPGRSVVAIDGRSPPPPALAAAADPKTFEVAVLESRFPQELPNQLLDALGEKGVDLAKDGFILSPTCAFAVYEAIVHAKPFVERYVTVAGGAIKRPAVLKARIGTSIGDLIEECGGFVDAPARVVVGGAVRGMPIHDLDSPVTKTTSSVLALTIGEIGSRRRRPCIRCGRCADACPELLDPERLYRLVQGQRWTAASDEGIAECTLCGACGYICPSRIPLVAAFAASPVASDRAKAHRPLETRP